MRIFSFTNKAFTLERERKFSIFNLFSLSAAAAQNLRIVVIMSVFEEQSPLLPNFDDGTRTKQTLLVVEKNKNTGKRRYDSFPSRGLMIGATALLFGGAALVSSSSSKSNGVGRTSFLLFFCRVFERGEESVVGVVFVLGILQCCLVGRRS